MKTWIYIDGFNLYYGAVKDTPYRWLDLHKMCQLLLPGHQIARIKYFTARVSGRSNDLSQPTRQQTYLRALRTLANLEIILGRFLSHEINDASGATGAWRPEIRASHQDRGERIRR